ncbi:unnamed protein product [Ilex paraguariensis]|uniref:VQ domain-containing protein n=2 Tax=Ilex paraguariensis TaxID=185542 RepID=A0ABC8UAV8_9AQUA
MVHSNTMMAPPSPTPTTFVQADTNTFRELVQKLTGASSDSQDKLPVTHPTRFSTKPVDTTRIRRSPFKLQERRQHTMRKLEVKLGLTSLYNSPRQAQSMLSSVQSPVTPLGCDSVFVSRVGTESPPSEEEKAIAAKGYYLHPSPRKAQPPELLTLFPLTSPRQESGDP